MAVALSAAAAGGCRDRQADTVTVLAASSLAEALSPIEAAYEARYPHHRVDIAFGSSSRLVAQVDAGARAAVVLTADEASARKLDAPSTTFARSRLVIVVQPGNPHGIRTIADLRRVRTVLAARGVPLGDYGDDVLRKAGVTVTPLSYEANARAVVTRVAQGEADAALAYAFDARGLTTVALPPDLQVEVAYQAAVLDRRGQTFVAFLLSDHAQDVLVRTGLERP